MDFYEVARVSKLPGMQTAMTLDPSHLSPRIKNAVIKGIKVRAVNGGYRATAAALARAIMNTHGIPFINTYRNQVDAGFYLPEEVRLQLVELYQADRIAHWLGSNAGAYDKAYVQYTIDCVKAGKWLDWKRYNTDPAIGRMSNPHAYHQRAGYSYIPLHMYSSTIGDKVRAIVAKEYQQDLHQPRALYFVEALTNNELISITKE